ncbi:hypothetical protein DIPPA_23411 [Diplonema papillatum]|nr:hypothetical protein DIPPA_23411 [Diplonema papillatum]
MPTPGDSPDDGAPPAAGSSKPSRGKSEWQVLRDTRKFIRAARSPVAASPPCRKPALQSRPAGGGRADKGSLKSPAAAVKPAREGPEKGRGPGSPGSPGRRASSLNRSLKSVKFSAESERASLEVKEASMRERLEAEWWPGVTSLVLRLMDEVRDQSVRDQEEEFAAREATERRQIEGERNAASDVLASVAASTKAEVYDALVKACVESEARERSAVEANCAAVGGLIKEDHDESLDDANLTLTARLLQLNASAVRERGAKKQDILARRGLELDESRHRSDVADGAYPRSLELLTFLSRHARSHRDLRAAFEATLDLLRSAPRAAAEVSSDRQAQLGDLKRAESAEKAWAAFLGEGKARVAGKEEANRVKIAAQQDMERGCLRRARAEGEGRADLRCAERREWHGLRGEACCGAEVAGRGGIAGAAAAAAGLLRVGFLEGAGRRRLEAAAMLVVPTCGLTLDEARRRQSLAAERAGFLPAALQAREQHARGLLQANLSTQLYQTHRLLMQHASTLVYPPSLSRPQSSASSKPAQHGPSGRPAAGAAHPAKGSLRYKYTNAIAYLSASDDTLSDSFKSSAEYPPSSHDARRQQGEPARGGSRWLARHPLKGGGRGDWCVDDNRQPENGGKERHRPDVGEGRAAAWAKPDARSPSSPSLRWGGESSAPLDSACWQAAPSAESPLSAEFSSTAAKHSRRDPLAGDAGSETPYDQLLLLETLSFPRMLLLDAHSPSLSLERSARGAGPCPTGGADYAANWQLMEEGDRRKAARLEARERRSVEADERVSKGSVRMFAVWRRTARRLAAVEEGRRHVLHEWLALSKAETIKRRRIHMAFAVIAVRRVWSRMACAEREWIRASERESRKLIEQMAVVSTSQRTERRKLRRRQRDDRKALAIQCLVSRETAVRRGIAYAELESRAARVYTTRCRKLVATFCQKEAVTRLGILRDEQIERAQATKMVVSRLLSSLRREAAAASTAVAREERTERESLHRLFLSYSSVALITSPPYAPIASLHPVGHPFEPPDFFDTPLVKSPRMEGWSPFPSALSVPVKPVPFLFR